MTPASLCDAEEREEDIGATKARVPRCFHGFATRPLTLPVRQKEAPQQHSGALGAHRCCRSRQLEVRAPTFVRYGTKHGAKSGRPARFRAPNWQLLSRDGAGRGTGRWLGQTEDQNGAAVAFCHGRV